MPVWVNMQFRSHCRVKLNMADCGDYWAPTSGDFVGDWGEEPGLSSLVLSGQDFRLLEKGGGCRKRDGISQQRTYSIFKHWICLDCLRMVFIHDKFCDIRIFSISSLVWNFADSKIAVHIFYAKRWAYINFQNSVHISN